MPNDKGFILKSSVLIWLGPEMLYPFTIKEITFSKFERLYHLCSNNVSTNALFRTHTHTKLFNTYKWVRSTSPQ